MRRAIWVVTLLFLAALQAEPVVADCGAEPAVPARPTDVRGSAWIGVLQSVEHVDGETDRHRWRVERVIDGDVPTLVACLTRGCWRVPEVRVGDRYLVSTAAIAAPTGLETIMYRLTGDQHVRIAPARLRPFHPPRFHVDTLAEAVALVAPALPRTDTAEPYAASSSGASLPGLMEMALRLLDLFVHVHTRTAGA